MDNVVENSDVSKGKYHPLNMESSPYNRHNSESLLNVLYSRETGTVFASYCRQRRWALFRRKNPCFHMRSLLAAKFVSSNQPFSYNVTKLFQTTKEVDKKHRPRQFEYHPSDSRLMAVGTLDGEVIVLNHETGNVLSCVSPQGKMSGILGLCWLKQQPTKLLVGSDHGSLRLLYNINLDHPEGGEENFSSSEVVFNEFEQLTSVHVNSTEDRCLASGYSKKVAIYDICNGQRLHLFTEMHQEPINVAKFANHCPNLFVTSSFDRYIKMWDLRQKPRQPCYTSSSKGGNVMAVFSPDDLYLLVSAIDNEVKQLLAVDGRLHTDFRIPSAGSSHNYTRSYYMNGRDYIISGSCEEPVVRICCAQTGRRLRDISLQGMHHGNSVFVQSLRSDPFRHFHMAVLAAYSWPMFSYEIIKINLLSRHSAEENGELSFCSSFGKGDLTNIQGNFAFTNANMNLQSTI